MQKLIFFFGKTTSKKFFKVLPYIFLTVLFFVEPAFAADPAPGAKPVFDDSEILKAVCQLLTLMEGAAGALLTAVAGVGALVGAAFGAYRAAFSLITVATASFIMPALVSLWFGTFNCIPVDAEGLEVGDTACTATNPEGCDTSDDDPECIANPHCGHGEPPCYGDDCEPEDCEGDDCEPEDCEGDDCEPEDCEGDDCEPVDPVDPCEGLLPSECALLPDSGG